VWPPVDIVIQARVMDKRLRAMTIPPDASIREAMLAIERAACELALVVDDEGHLNGTASDGDLRRGLLAGAKLDDPVKPHVTTAAVVASPADSRAEVLDVMRARSVSQVPVVDERGRLVSIHLLRELIGASPRDNIAVVMAGGRGTRLAPLTESVPKPMVRVAGRPILERLVLHLVGSGIQRVVLAINYLAEQIIDYFGDGEHFGCRIDYVREDPLQPLGTGGALRLVPEVVGDLAEPLLVLNGDLVTQVSLEDLLAHHASIGGAATVAVRDYSYEIPYGVAEEGENGYLERFLEKPVLTHRVNAGLYVLSPHLLERIPPETEYPLPSLLVDAVTRGERVGLWTLTDEWHDVGQHQDLERARGRL
jgi:dTDP-glucose pyrophosphorylase/CBS domain-containing protein